MSNIFLFDGKNWVEEKNRPYAFAGQIIVAKNKGILNAHGGDCRVILIYDESQKMGALIHIPAADIFIDSFKDFIDGLLDQFKFTESSQSLLCGDLRYGCSGDESLIDLRKNWDQSILMHLKKQLKGKKTKVVRKGFGKNVFLDVKSGHVQVSNDKGKIIFEKYLTNTAHGQLRNFLLGEF